MIILLTGILAPLISPYSETSNDLTATLVRRQPAPLGWGPTSSDGTR